MTTERPVLDIEQTISGSPEAVFDAWLDPAQLKLWFCGSDTDVTAVEIDARVGGAYRIVMSDHDRDWPHTGIYREIDRPRKLVFTWCTPSTDEQETLVTVTLTPEAGKTRLRLIHQHLPAATLEGHREGWCELFQQLDALIATGRA
jgi:uncharacterized protein YndB with AHSA1/START domain